MKKIVFITGHDSNVVNKRYLNLTPNGKGKFKNCQFFFNELIRDYDYIVVLEQLKKRLDISISSDRLIFIAGEGSSIKKYKKKFLDQFGHVITCQTRIKHNSKLIRSPGHSWFFTKKTYDELLNTTKIEKTKSLSIIVSNKTMTKGHRNRLLFCLKLKKRLGNRVDLFGRGFKEFDDKWDMIAPYKYSVAIENSIEDHWITEKLTDCFASHTYPFYVGAPNAKDYYNSNSFAVIDIEDFEKSVTTILNILDDPKHYEKHLKFVKDSKIRYLNKHSVIPMVCNFINERLDNLDNKTKSSLLKIFPENRGYLHTNKMIKKVKRYLRYFFYKILYLLKL